MKGTWNLDPIYLGFDDPAFGQDMEQLRDVVGRMERFANELQDAAPAEALRTGIELQEQMYRLNLNRRTRFPPRRIRQ